MTILAVDEFMRLGSSPRRGLFGDDDQPPIRPLRGKDNLSCVGEFRKAFAIIEHDMEPEGHENGHDGDQKLVAK